MTNDEIEDYDLSTTGTIVELEGTSTHEIYGFLVDANAAVDLVVEMRGGTVGYKALPDFSADGTTFLNDGFQGPEVVDIRIRNTSTENDTADAVLGSGGR
jgi:hypothetical protein